MVDLFFLLTDEVPECSSLRVPKIYTIFGVVGMLRLVAGEHSSLETLLHDLLVDVVDVISDYFMPLIVLCLEFLFPVYWKVLVGVQLYLYDCATM